MPLSHPEQLRALDIARAMARSGIPVFIAPPNPAKPTGFDLPSAWEATVADARCVDLWQPGWALCAVGGHLCDFLDTDPRNDGHVSREALQEAGAWPVSYGRQATPSGGTHDVIAPLGVGKVQSLVKGVDLQGGRADGTGRGFIFLAPTVRPSKVDGVARSYRWLVEPDLFSLVTARRDGTDKSGITLAGMVHQAAVKTAAVTVRPAGFWCDFSPSKANKIIAAHLTDVTTAAEQGWSGFRDALMRSAYALGGFVGSDYLSYADADERLVLAIKAAGHEPDDDDLLWIEQGLTDGQEDPLWVRLRDPEVPDGPLDLTEQASALVDAEGFAAKLIDAADLDELPDPEPLISKWLYQDTTARLVGQPGSYKSFVALDMACCVALGMDWHGHEVTQSPVLYVVGEGLSGYKRRVRAWCEAHGVDKEKLRGRLVLTRGSVQIGSAEWSALSAWVIDNGVRFVIGDTQAKMSIGSKENDNDAQGVVYAHLDALRQATGGTLLLLHHTGHANGDAGERGRGASSWRAAVETELLLTKTGDYIAVLRNDRQKEAESGQEVTVRLRPAADSLVAELDLSVVPRYHLTHWLAQQVAFGTVFESGSHIIRAAREAGHKIGNDAKSTIFEEYYAMKAKHHGDDSSDEDPFG